MNTLCGVVQNQMGTELRPGDIFIFVNRRRNTVKLLQRDNKGLILYIRKLEDGTFRMPAYDQKTRSFPMLWQDLVKMVDAVKDDPDSRLRRLKALRSKDSKSPERMLTLYQNQQK